MRGHMTTAFADKRKEILAAAIVVMGGRRAPKKASSSTKRTRLAQQSFQTASCAFVSMSKKPSIKLKSLRKGFGHVDDVAIIESSSSLEGNSREIESAITQSISWSAAAGMTCNAERSELKHLAQRTRDKGVGPEIQTNSFVISGNPDSAVPRVAGALRCFGNTISRVHPRPLPQNLGGLVNQEKKAGKLLELFFPSTEPLRETGISPAESTLDPLLTPPWTKEETKEDSLVRIDDAPEPRDWRIHNFDKFLPSPSRSDILVHSDGSVSSDYVILQLGYQIDSGAQSLDNSKEVYDAKIHAALQGIEAVIDISFAHFASNLWAFLGNQEVARKLLSNIPC
ncbi:hypothetical protein BGHDH14_bghG003019000001001 [Blumeria hordei DH14]|uniref:Uncharacterized protein n=1 Tax=Blumeria graminis f. sp. hordei (strain DH14) TaxID=546991 RepID=N1JFV1_BLUG1|nr:hypothetical protein BGHDH14_bghG003019000001001 [Blumeria hordei DH14]